ncbi:hypothetical protein [Streptomyces parvulus]
MAAIYTAFICVLVSLSAFKSGIPTNVTVTSILLAPHHAKQLLGRLDARAREHFQIIEGDGPCRYLQHLAALQGSLVQAAAGSDRYELRRSAELGHSLLWDAAGLLQNTDDHSTSARLIAYQRLMLQLAAQVSELRPAPGCGADDADRTVGQGQRLSPPPAASPAAPLEFNRLTNGSPLEGTLLVPQPAMSPDRNQDVFLLFAHEAYYPGPDTQEINTTVVAAASLLHPQISQPDGIRMHDLLTRGRRAGEIIPLATLTHELGGGADWPAVGDWERVTADLVQLSRAGYCDALSLGLPEVARALLCSGPHSHVRAFDAVAGEFIDYGPRERAAALAEVEVFLASILVERDLWPGNGLLSPLALRP